MSHPDRSTPGGGPTAELEQVGLTGWPSGLPGGRIPEMVRTDVGGLTVQGYPALVTEPTAGAGTGPHAASGGKRGSATRSGSAAGTAVSLRVLADAATQASRHAEGVRELLLLELALPTGRVTSRWPVPQALTLGASPYPTTEALVTDLQRAAVDALLIESTSGNGDGGPAQVRDAETYARLRGLVRNALEDRTFQVANDAATVLAEARELDVAVRAATSMALLTTVTDLRGQIDRLVHDGFLTRAGAGRLPHLARYLRAGRRRLEKALEDPRRDEGLGWQVRELEQEHAAAVGAARSASPDPVRDERLAEVGWMIEELRVSLFAQQLGTAHPVSAKRIRTALAG